MKKFIALGAILAVAGCVSTETAIHSYNGSSVEVELYGDTFAFGSEAQKQAQIDAAKAKADQACGKPTTFLSRRMDHQPQNGIYMVQAKNIAVFKCK